MLLGAGRQEGEVMVDPIEFGETTDVIPTSTGSFGYEQGGRARDAGTLNAHFDGGVHINPLPSSGPRASGSADGHHSWDGRVVEAEQLSIVLDEDCNKLKRNVMDLFKFAKSQMTERAQMSVDAERRECARNLASKQAEVDALFDTKSQNEDAIKRLNTIVARAVEFKLNSTNALQEKYLRLHAMAAWKMFHKNRKNVRHKIEQWMSYHTKTYIVGRVFKLWRSDVHANLHQSLRMKYETIMEQERNKQLAEQADLIDGLKAEIFELSNKLELEEAGRKLLEEEMKRAFMRGVCALNIEAMGLMKSGHRTSDSNEFHGATSEESSLQYTRQSESAPPVFNVESGISGPAFSLSPGVKDTPVRLASGTASAALERFLAQVGRKY